MLFTLEVLQAKKGDALLLHLGSADDPRLIVLDGGPAGVYRKSLRPRLEELRAARNPGGALEIDLMMVSHIDDDHIHGLIDLTDKLIDQQSDQQELDYRIRGLWHNAFDDVLGNNSDVLLETVGEIAGEASVGGGAAALAGLSQPAALVLASVGQGQRLRDNANALGIELNSAGEGGLIVAPGDGSALDHSLAVGVETLVVGPSKARLRKLQADWDKKVAKQQQKAEAAAYLDKSVYNLASLVLLLRAEGKEMLLTGDARGDDILAGMAEAGLLDDEGSRHVDILKMPHHGSDRNVETDFFRDLTADHYVISGDGAHGNPELATYEMLLSARRLDNRPFTLYLTYPLEEHKGNRGHPYPAAEVQALFQRERDAGQQFEVVFPAAGKISTVIDLLDSFAG